MPSLIQVTLAYIDPEHDELAVVTHRMHGDHSAAAVFEMVSEIDRAQGQMVPGVDRALPSDGDDPPCVWVWCDGDRDTVDRRLAEVGPNLLWDLCHQVVERRRALKAGLECEALPASAEATVDAICDAEKEFTQLRALHEALVKFARSLPQDHQ